jgi:3-oxoacyl-[acyl-carrier-protein] synthase II
MGEDVVVTGMGAVSCLGIGLDHHWQTLLAGRGGVVEIGTFPTDGWPCRSAGTVNGLDPRLWIRDRKALRAMDRHTYFAFAAVGMALSDARLEPPLTEDTAILMGTGMIDYDLADLEPAASVSAGPDGQLDLRALGQEGIQLIYPLLPAELLNNATMCQIAMQYQVKGPNATFSSFGESGAQAIGEGFRMVARGEAEVALVGGYSLRVNPQSLARFSLMGLLSTADVPPATCCRPWDRDRDGMVLGEGAAALVLEPLSRARQRGARPRARLAGYGSCTSRSERPYPSEDAIASSLSEALSQAGLHPHDLGYIHADAPGLQTDATEADGIAAVLGEASTTIPVSSSKGATGHLLAGAAPLELAVAVLALEQNLVPPTVNLAEPYLGCPISVARDKARPADIHAAACMAAGFGGQSVSLVIADPGR